jgi:hypothetical protein
MSNKILSHEIYDQSVVQITYVTEANILMDNDNCNKLKDETQAII